MATIQILGTGCSRCRHLLVNARRAVQAAGRTDTVEKIRDFARIVEFNPSALPALVINGKVVTTGSIPSPAQIQTLLATTEERELARGSQIT
jgi:small redox-active disulfide protein 2